jgi:CspA family cold shock protein
MPTGNVRWFNEKKGYGFVTDVDGNDAFLHISELPDNVEYLQEGQKVEYSIIDSKRGATATQVKLLDEPPTLVPKKIKSADEMVQIIEDTITLLDSLEEIYRKNRQPDKSYAKKVAIALKGVAKDIT